jgi:hypothetical protein
VTTGFQPVGGGGGGGVTSVTATAPLASSGGATPNLSLVVPLPTTTREVYVNQGGNDATGNGTIEQPYATIAKALSTITDAATGKRYVILLGPGNWPENIALKSWVWIVGTELLVTRLNGNITLDGVTWAPNVDQRGGFTNCILRGSVTINFNAAASTQGKVYFDNCWLNNAPTFQCAMGLLASGINQVNLEGCHLFGGMNQFGCTVTLSHTAFQNGAAIVLTSVNDGSNSPTNLAGFDSSNDGTLSATWTASGGPNAVSIVLLSCPQQGGISLSGAQATLTATADSIVGGVSLAGGALAPSLLTLSSAVADGTNTGNAVIADPGTVAGVLEALAGTGVIGQNSTRNVAGTGACVGGDDNQNAGAGASVCLGGSAQFNQAASSVTFGLQTLTYAGMHDGAWVSASGALAGFGTQPGEAFDGYVLSGVTTGLAPGESVVLNNQINGSTSIAVFDIARLKVKIVAGQIDGGGNSMAGWSFDLLVYPSVGIQASSDPGTYLPDLSSDVGAAAWTCVPTFTPPNLVSFTFTDGADTKGIAVACSIGGVEVPT